MNNVHFLFSENALHRRFQLAMTFTRQVKKEEIYETCKFKDNEEKA